MSDDLANLFDFRLAWGRARRDQPERVFVRHPYEIELVEVDRDAWLARLENSIRSDTYNPSPIVICDVPKGQGALRPAGHLTIDDRIVYAACVGACLSSIHDALTTREPLDFAYRLAADVHKPEWLQSQFGGWTNFRKRSVAKIAPGISYVVIADISAYYENIDIATLASDLRQIGAPELAISQLSNCLNRWAQVTGRGLPQGHSPSDILAKLYLHSVDTNLRDMGYEHYRYVDDFRVFCKDLVDAKLALKDLTLLLRKRGLNLQAAKSEIHRADKAKRIIEGITPIIDSVRHTFVSQMAALFNEEYSAMSMTDFEALLAASTTGDPRDAPIEIIKETYQTYFIDSSTTFDKSLFRFLLGRLGTQNDIFAVEHCKTLFEKYPQETSNILEYFEDCGVVTDVQESIVSFLNSKDAVYPYQAYQMLEWLNRVLHHSHNGLTALARRIAFSNTEPFYLRSVARKFIAVHGTTADLERLEDAYAIAQGSLEQSEIICALRRMELNRRNSFLRRAEGDGDLNFRATRLVRSP
jgi:Reverse transcriptase (RNA-dependent DNA polymerase)